MVIQKRLEKLMQNLSKEFNLEKLSKSPARFNLQKLEWFNREYIKLISLSEFAERASLNQLQISPGLELRKQELKFRTGDYVLFVDAEKQKVLCIQDEVGITSFGGRYYLIGGGREANETYQENLLREVQEETYSKIDLDLAKIKKICQYKAYSPFRYTSTQEDFDGRDINVYFYPLKVGEIDGYTLIDGGNEHKVDWYNLSDLIENNQYLNYPIWQNFCTQNNIQLFQPTKKVQYQYLAWLLDKNRISKLSEFGTESDCVLNWKEPEMADLTWKKSTSKQSLENLEEISKVVLNLLDSSEFLDLQSALIKSIFTSEVGDNFTKLVDFLEQNLKNWLTENSKQVGDYLWPLRVSLSAKQKSPSPFELLAVLEPDEAKRRIQACLDNNS